MANYKRRFTKDEFSKELFQHLRDMPPGHLRAHDKLAENAKLKAEHYSRALDALDAAMSRVEKVAASHPDPIAQSEAREAVKEINAAIDAYGEASLSGNSTWGPVFASE